jgi:hypothetical protein
VRVAKPGGKRRRTIPVPAVINSGWSCDYFDESDVPTLAERLRQPPIVAASQVVGQLNLVSANFLIRYAAHKVPTPNSKTSEWCSALERDVEALMETLGVPDKGFPEDLMNVQARAVLTNHGTRLLPLTDFQLLWMRLGGDPMQVLDRVPAALWGLKKVAANASRAYGERARQRDPRKNARQPQNAYLLQELVLLFQACFGVTSPPKRPNHDGPFVQSVDFVRQRLVQQLEGGHDFTDQGTDKLAARRLRDFGPQAIASLWIRDGQQLMAGIAKYRDLMSRGSPGVALNESLHIVGKVLGHRKPKTTARYSDQTAQRVASAMKGRGASNSKVLRLALSK